MDIADLLKQVKRNCDVSDARFWGYYSICGLLMRYRELYLSEHSLLPWGDISKEQIYQWISEREAKWRDLEEEELNPLLIDGRSYGPFELDGLNCLLRGFGLIYGAGYGMFRKPTFFIADLKKTDEVYDYQVHHTENEHCRDLFAAPAMLQGRCIYVRLDIIRTVLWDKYQLMRSGQHRGVLEEMFRLYGLSKTDSPSNGLFAGIEGLAHAVKDLFVLHEIGEAFEDEYSDVWTSVLCRAGDKYLELYLRGTKDLLADTSTMGPLYTFIKEKNKPLLFMYMAFLEGIRKEIFPEIRNAFQLFIESGDWSQMEEARKTGYEKAVALTDKVVTIWAEHDDKSAAITSIKQCLQQAFPKR